MSSARSTDVSASVATHSGPDVRLVARDGKFDSAFIREPTEKSPPADLATKIITMKAPQIFQTAIPSPEDFSSSNHPPISRRESSTDSNTELDTASISEPSGLMKDEGETPPRITLKLRIPARRKLDDSGSSPSEQPPAKIARIGKHVSPTTRILYREKSAETIEGAPTQNDWRSAEADGDDVSMDGTTIIGEESVGAKAGGGRQTTSVNGDTVGGTSDSGRPSIAGACDSSILGAISDSDLTSLSPSSTEDEAVDDGESEIDVPDSDHEQERLRNTAGARTSTFVGKKKVQSISSALRVCRNAGCNNELPLGFRYKYCLSCRPKLPEHLDQTLSQTPSHTVPPSASRSCVIVSCRRPIPPLETYRWKLCQGCRNRTRLQARARKQALINSVRAAAGAPPGLENNNPPLEQCANKRCRAEIPYERDDVLCEPCRNSCDSVQDGVNAVLETKRTQKTNVPDASNAKAARSAQKSKRPAKHPGPDSSTQGKPPRTLGLPQPILLPAELNFAVKHSPAPPPPATGSTDSLATGSESRATTKKTYQHIAEIMLSLQESVRTLVRKHAHEIETVPVALNFGGEFSVVSGQRKNEQTLCLNAVCKELEKALSVKLYNVKTSTLNGSGIHVQYDCLQRIEFSVATPIQPGVGTLPPPPKRQFIRLAGDVNIKIDSDEQHRFIPGHRVSIQISFVG